MRIRSFAPLALAWTIIALVPRSSPAIDCSRDSTGLVPLIDLGAGLYQGYEGGLYAGGSNHRPQAHNDAGVAIARALVPLDTLGAPDPTGGRIVLISIGMSNCTQEFQRFVPKAMSDPDRNPQLLVIDCAEGGQAADLIKDPQVAYWDTVVARLRHHGSSPAQVQAVWIKEANRRPTGSFPASADTFLWNLGTVVRNIRSLLPNAKLAYITSRIYAGYATTDLNPEPYAYESGFSVKWLIDAQIQGVDSLNYDAGHGAVHAPWIAWGPYLWADGLEPRSDGFTWPCADFASDGTHPSTLGQDLVADSLLAYFKADETTAPWFLRSTTSVPSPASGLSFAISPNPSRGLVTMEFSARGPWRLTILGPRGTLVRDLGGGTAGALLRSSWDGRDQKGRLAAPGVYWVRLVTAEGAVTHRLIRAGR